LGIEEETGNEKAGERRLQIIIWLNALQTSKVWTHLDVEQQETETKLKIKKETKHEKVIERKLQVMV
jgi:hypothetical protein